MNLRLLLLSPEGETRKLYHSAIDKLGVKLDVVGSFKEVCNAMSNVPYSGVLVDLNTKLRSTKDDLDLAERILESFPVAEMRCDNKTKKIGMFYQGQSKDGGSLDDFVNRICKLFNPRKVATEKRLKINFNIVISATNDFEEKNVERAITINVSKGGCFILSTDKWQIGDSVWFIIKDLEDQTPICGKVCWCVEWGKQITIPGVGLQFKIVKENQMADIYNTKIQNEMLRV